MNDRFTRRNDNKIEVLHDYTYTHKISKRFLRNIHHKWLKRTLNSCLMCREKYFFPSFDCDNMCDVSCVCGLWIYRWFILRFQSLNCLHKTLSNAVHFWFFFQLPATAIVVTVSYSISCNWNDSFLLLSFFLDFFLLFVSRCSLLYLIACKHFEKFIIKKGSRAIENC